MIVSSPRVALVTGASKGIGLAIAEHLCMSGIDVFICSRSIENLVSAANNLSNRLSFQSDVGKLHAHCCDVTDKKSVENLINTISEKYGRLNILVNNCGGLSSTGTFNDLSEEQWIDCLNTNLMSAVLLSKTAHPLLKASKSGRVINISSLVAIQPGLYNPHYAAAKAGLLALSKNLSMLWASDGILVNSISPGIIETEGWHQYIVDKAAESNQAVEQVSREEYDRAASNVPLDRLGTAKEVASCVAFLAGEESTYITGSNLVVDGGKFRAI